MSKLDKFASQPSRAWSHDKWIDVRYLEDLPEKARRPERKPFTIDFVKLPTYWIEQLKRARHSATFKLAHHILREDYKQKYGGGGEIVLSDDATGLARSPRRRAIKEMIDLKLIRVQQKGKQAPRVIQVLHNNPDPKLNGGTRDNEN